MTQPDFRQLPRDDQAVLGCGLLAFVASFLPYYGASVNALGLHASSSTTAWHSYATLAMLLVLAATVVKAIQVFSATSLPEMGLSWTFVVAGLSVLGAALLIIRSFTLDSGHVAGVSFGLKWGAYVLMVLCVAQAVFAVLRLRASGEQMPWQSGASA